MKALTRLGQSAAKPLLLHIYRQSDSAFSKDDWSVRTLAGIGESVVLDLSSALASLSPNIKVAALEFDTAQSFRTVCLAPSLALIQDTDPRVRSSALKTVQALGIAPRLISLHDGSRSRIHPRSSACFCQSGSRRRPRIRVSDLPVNKPSQGIRPRHPSPCLRRLGSHRPSGRSGKRQRL